MAEDVLRSGPFTSVNQDRLYTSEFFRDYFASFIGNGVFPNPSDNLQVMVDSGLDIVVKKGKAWIDGAIHLGDDDQTLTLDPGDNLLPRIDKIVLKMNLLTRTITKEIKKGTPATNPVAPNLQRDIDIYELGLANVRVNVGATNITQSDITDLRLNSNECGIVKGTIEEIDTTTLFNQYQNWIEQKKAEFNQDLITYTNTKQSEFEGWVDNKESDYNTYVGAKQSEWDNWYDTTTTQLEADFMAWFSMLEDVLDENTAGNLLNMINSIPKIYSGATEPSEIATGDYWFREVN